MKHEWGGAAAAAAAGMGSFADRWLSIFQCNLHQALSIHFMSDWGTYVGIEKFQNWKRKKCHIVLFFVTVVCDKVIDQKVIVIWAAWAMTLVTWQNNFKNREWMWRHCKSEFQFRNLILKLFPQKCGRSNRSPGLSWSGREPFVRELLIRGCWSRVMGPYPTR